MSTRPPARPDRAAIQSRLEVLERERPEGWRFEVERLCDQWAEGEGLPKQPQPTSRAELHDEHPALAVQPDPDLGISCPYCHRPYDVPDETPAGIPAVDPERFIDALLTGAASAAEVGERLLLLACCLNQAGADIQAAPRGSRQLALWLDVSHVTAAARLNGFKADFIEQFAHCLNNRPYR